MKIRPWGKGVLARVLGVGAFPIGRRPSLKL